MSSKNGTAKRELIDTGNDKRYVRRDANGRFEDVESLGRSVSQETKRHSKTAVRTGKAGKTTSIADPMYKAWGKVYANRGKK